MKQPFPLIRFGRSFMVKLAATIAALGLGLTAIGFAWRFYPLADENGPMEDLQLVVLVAAFAAFLYSAVKAGRLQGLLLALAGAVTLMLLQREIDFHSFGDDHWLLSLRSTSFRVAFWSLIAVALIGWAVWLRRPFSDLVPLISLKRLWPALIAAAFLAASLPLELASRAAEGRFAAHFLMFLEELSETNAYVVILLVAVVIARRAWRRP